MQEAKKVIRSQTLKLIRDQDNKKLELWGEKLRQHLFTLVDDLFSKFINQNQEIYVGGFSPLDDEVLWDINFPHLDQLAYPAIDQDDLVFRHCHPKELEEQLIFGKKLRVPTSDKGKITPEILIIPGVAFSPRGERLGRGKGFYDRYLKTYQGTRIGICYELQLNDQLPTNDQDERVHYVVTEKRVIDCL